MQAGPGELVEILAARGLAPAVISRAQAIASSGRTHLLRALNQMGELTDDAFADIVAGISGWPVIASSEFPQVAIATELSLPFMRARQVIPLCEEAGAIDVGFVNPLDVDAVAGVRFALGPRLRDCVVVTAAAWRRAFSMLHDEAVDLASSESSVEEQVLSRIFDQDRDAPVARRVATFLSDAIARRASDIHIEARRNHVDVRMRVDGRLELYSEEPAEAASALIARVKVLADLDLGERRRPQDGRTTFVVAGRPVDVRVSIVPAAEGESAVLRLLDRPSDLMTLEGLGFSGDHRDLLRQTMTARDGLFLVAGPTGSGKTTTLYACLQLLANSGLKIVSVEDPIEYHFAHVIQVQTNEAADLDFPTALRSFLRHDPDVIFVGEIRDRETAQVAVQAALTGHLVVASIHAIDAPRVVARLIDMGVDQYQLDAALRRSMSQRLVRQLCSCADDAPIDEQAQRVFERGGIAPPPMLKTPRGCDRCGWTGYFGRILIAEFSHKGAIQGNMFADGLSKVAAGVTTLSELLFAVDSA